MLRADGLKETDIDTPIRTEGSKRASIQYLMGRLPSQKWSKLQQAAGKIPPSEGIIINADGRVITQAVGYSDDHYLPFNLKNLKGLQGGHYVRSRSQGGLTTEDIYTGLVSGARSVTVVSRSGVFTMNFEDDFRGGRRYNDKAAGMVSRYAKTLDAVKSKQVEREPLKLEERAAIRDEVEEEYKGMDLPRGELEDLVKERENEYKSRPSLTKDELAEIDALARKDNEGDDRKYRMARSALITDRMEAKTQRAWQLDGEGYSVAMEALREQFPYYVSSVQYQTKRGAQVDTPFTSEQDVGYVKPRYIRPEGAREGYFDESITGRGKISADRLNYANWPNNPENKASRPKAELDENGEPKAAEGIKINSKIDMQQKIAEGKRKVAANESLQKVAQLYVDAIAEGDNNYPAVKRAATDFESMVNSPAQLEELHTQLKKLDTVVANAKAAPWPDRHREAQAHFKAIRAAQQGTLYSPDKVATYTEQPYEFDIEGGKRVGYSNIPGRVGHDAEVEKEWRQQQAKAKLPIEIGQYSDEKLGKMAAAFGYAGHALKEGRDNSMLVHMAEKGMPDDYLERTAKYLQMGKGEELADGYLKMAEAMHRMRRLQANHSRTQGSPAAGREVGSTVPVHTPQTTPEAVGNTSSATHVSDVTGAAKAAEEFAAEGLGAGIAPTMVEAHRKLARALEGYSEGEMNKEQLTARIHETLENQSLTHMQVATLRSRLKKHGMDIED
jgi:hypothetical protein